MKQQYPATLTGRACMVKDNKGFVYMAFRKFFLWGTYSGVVLSGQDSAIFPAWVANCTAGFGSSCRLMELGRYKTLLQLTVTGYQGKMPNIYKAHLCHWYCEVI